MENIIKKTLNDRYIGWNVSISKNFGFLEKLFSIFALYTIVEVNKEGFITNILKANKELEKPFSISEESVDIEIQKLLAEKQIIDTNHTYYISINQERKDEILSSITQEEKQAYFELIKLFISKNMEANQKKKV